ncbi:Extradiol ring-cleavage dioxygenase, class III enzyme, subunit B [Microdochium bolleyi]|uniref:Extradiol ring-cleavage dioxygenase, class III enzyme, subunit B n=1 Tax=Microdochium bolleyi TaxID=196109 RepID=A0A136IL64_9PEZI|nr:Extradiol ring-cleavage dioxygenase, class III enzyme, subunit B [Microdochium bolleyi]
MGRAAAICISHGGGPMPVLGDPGHKHLVASMKNRVPKVLKLGTPEAPRAIVVVTAHWSTKHPTVSSGAKHSLYYDYGGFPAEAYKLKYDAPGSPEVAEEVQAALTKAGFAKTTLDSERGWDHGVFIPFLLINPAADVPIVQMSVLDSEDPADHFRMGQALSALRDSNIAIVGSGFASFHNLRIMFSLRHQDPQSAASFKATMDTWNQQVTSAVEKEDVQERAKALGKWRDIENSYTMHPRGGAEHFLPLIVTAGAATGAESGDTFGKYADEFVGLDMWTYYWADSGVAEKL